ncbi:YicC/YloC family endoribonuclease [Candidatus Enterovibrio escicola]|uniref:YicC/YloC family endoribonuclease n=1 Tax=Candidatus Enterovibrio escicola TaxID=1927127 RepID=UPI001237D99A|nr:YicC/YloC family endoribonuclease [Candidatus Enterovibrio escacola]
MIYSMTAYSRQGIKNTWGSAIWEIHSVNHRYLETCIRMPEQFRGLEPILRERLRQRLSRGKVECSLRFEANSSSNTQLCINEELAKKVIHAAKWIKKLSGEGNIEPFQVLQWPGVMEDIGQNRDSINKELIENFDETVVNLIAARAREGNNMRILIEQRLMAINVEVIKIRTKIPEILNWQRQRLIQKLEEVKLKLDAHRIEQEMILMAQKTDVAEELERLDSHVSETKRILAQGGACGRRLDFMMQELNRESNTLASKSISTEVTTSGIELKVLIEQIREQIQNIE